MGKTALLAWEFGANLGHVTNLGHLARVLLHNGYRVVLVLKELDTIRSLLSQSELERVTLLLTPKASISRAPTKNVMSVMEILINWGFDDRAVLEPVVCLWREIIEAERPDVVMADYAPTLLLALRALNGHKPSKVLMVGSGFGEIPEGAAAIDILLSPQRNIEKANELEQVVLRGINEVCGSLSLKALAVFSDLFSVDHTFLFTVAEFDFYRRDGTPHSYIGSLGGPEGNPPVHWPDEQGPLVFAYLRPGARQFVRVVEALRRIGCSCVMFAPGLREDDVVRLSTRKLSIVTRPVDLQSVLRDTDLLIHHGGMGTMFAGVQKGVPCMAVPTQLEQQNLGWRTEELGFGLSIGWDESVQNIRVKIERQLNEPRFERVADALMYRYGNLTPEKGLALVMDAVESK